MTGPTRNASPGFALAIHGGAGTLRRGLMDEARSTAPGCKHRWPLGMTSSRQAAARSTR